MENIGTMSLLSYKTYVSQIGGFQELLRRSRTKVEQIGRSETQDPGVDFVSHLWENPNKYENTDTSNATNACGPVLRVLLHCSLSYSTTACVRLAHPLPEVDEVVCLVNEEQL